MVVLPSGLTAALNFGCLEKVLLHGRRALTVMSIHPYKHLCLSASAPLSGAGQRKVGWRGGGGGGGPSLCSHSRAVTQLRASAVATDCQFVYMNVLIDWFCCFYLHFVSIRFGYTVANIADAMAPVHSLQDPAKAAMLL